MENNYVAAIFRLRNEPEIVAVAFMRLIAETSLVAATFRVRNVIAQLKCPGF